MCSSSQDTRTLQDNLLRIIKMKVEVYFNLHKRVFSVRSCKTGRVIHHTKNVHIRDPQFVVREGGRQRVLRERKKNVHAFVRGYATYFEDGIQAEYNYGLALFERPTLDTIGYNPFMYDSFVKMPDETPVHQAERAWLNVNGNDMPTIQAEGVQ
jgi:hypothetical protein